MRNMYKILLNGGWMDSDTFTVILKASSEPSAIKRALSISEEIFGEAWQFSACHAVNKDYDINKEYIIIYNGYEWIKR